MGESVVIEALRASTSQDPELLKRGEDLLKSWEGQAGFYRTLSVIFTEHRVETSVRWMAITYIKNGVDRYWRKGAISPIDPEEKDVVRHCLLSGLEEPVNQVSVQLAVLISRIARMDCPEQWPQLLPVLTASIQSPSSLMQQRALLTLKYVMKTMAGRRLANDRKLFYKITEGLFVPISELWNHHTQHLLQSEPIPAVAVNAECAKNCLKVLRQLIVYGLPRFHVVPEVVAVVNVLFDRIKLFLDYRTRCVSDLSKHVESMITVAMKSLTELHAHHPLGYVGFLDKTYQLIISYMFTSDGAGKLYDKFVVQCLTLLRQVLKCEDYQMPTNLLSCVPPSEVMQAQMIRTSVFRSAILQEMIRHLIMTYLILSEQDMQNALESAEEFVQGEGDGDVYKVAVKPCVEVTYLTIFSEFQQTVQPVVMEMLNKVQARGCSASDQELFEKEAVYRAVGLAAYELYEQIDYDNWYSTQLIRELEITDQRYLLVRYRVVWLLGNWVSVKMSTELRPSLYSCLLQLLHPSEKLVIRLAASQSLYSSIDDFTFTAEDFSPFISDMISHLLHLLADVEECDTKLKVLQVISLIVDCCGRHIQPHVFAIAQQMPVLWEQSAKHNLLRCSILTTLMKITQGLGEISNSLHSLLIPVIALATDPTQASYVYLGEDGLILWLTTLEYSHSLSLELVQLFSQNMPKVMGLAAHDSTNTDLSPDSLLTCFKIIENYCTLGGADFLQACGGVVVDACQEYITDVKSECTRAILEVLNRVIKASHTGGAQLIHRQLFTVFLATLRAEDHPPVMSGYFTTLANLLYYSSMTFFSLIEQASTHLQQNVENLFCSFVDLWHNKLNIIVSLEQRKMIGLAISTLLPINDRCVLSRFGVLFSMCLEVLHDVCDHNDNDVLFDNLCIPDGVETSEHEEYSKKRSQQLQQVDPVWTVELHRVVSTKLEECELTHGASRFHLLLQSVDWSVREQMCEYLPPEQAVKLLFT